MPREPEGPPPELRPVLDGAAFRGRLSAEVARLRRSGGFLSLALLRAHGAALDRLRATVRLQDVLGVFEGNPALLMTDTTAAEADRAARRLLEVIWKDVPSAARLESAGLATAYGEVEGGGEALLASAAEALRGAPTGQIAPSPTMAGRPRVLVVDDDMTFARALADELFERGWEGHPCTLTEDAFQRVTDGNYHALFIDLVLHGATGVEVLRRALAFNPRRPAVLMSGYDADHEMLLGALELGPVTFLRKPIASADLDAALQMFRVLLPGIRHRPALR